MFDYTTVYNKWEFDEQNAHRNNLCQAVTNTCKTLSTTIKSIQEFHDNVENYSKLTEKTQQHIALNDITKCSEKCNINIENLNSLLFQVLFMSYEDPKYAEIDYKLKKLYLSYIYNLKNINLFKTDTQSIINVKRIQHFRPFIMSSKSSWKN